MADVLIVCVREDEPQAKALADMFERAGFSVGGAPSNEGALKSSGAGVIVWSHASIRSRPFLDAAQRVVNAKKAVVACLIEPPPAASINDSPAFDLSAWSGDPDDPHLDPLFFAVDRMVNSARASVGAPAAAPPQAPAYEPPPNLRAPPSAPPYARAARTAPPEPKPPPQPQLPPGFQMRQPARVPAPEVQNDPLSSEAEHWRAIRHSTDPTVFLDYLARYGDDGAFSELADQKLQALQGAQRPAARAPEPRAYTPPPAEPPPQRRRDPAPDYAQEREREHRAREREREKSRSRERFDGPVRETRIDEPKRSSGLAGRLLILFLLLGGGALAAGWYFGGGGGLSVDPPVRQERTAGATDEPSSAPADGAESDPTAAQANGQGGPLSEAQPIDYSTRESAAPPAGVRTPPAPASAPEEDGPTPAPTYSWAPAGGQAQPSYGGPVSLIPAAPAQQPPATQPEAAAQPASIQATTVPAPAARGAVSWAQRPTAARISALYPRRALREQIGGRAVLDCQVRADLGVACTLVSESPAGAGFGRAALDSAAYYRAGATLSDGSPAVGARTRLSLVFQPPRD